MPSSAKKFHCNDDVRKRKEKKARTHLRDHDGHGRSHAATTIFASSRKREREEKKETGGTRWCTGLGGYNLSTIEPVCLGVHPIRSIRREGKEGGGVGNWQVPYCRLQAAVRFGRRTLEGLLKTGKGGNQLSGALDGLTGAWRKEKGEGRKTHIRSRSIHGTTDMLLPVHGGMGGGGRGKGRKKVLLRAPPSMSFGRLIDRGESFVGRHDDRGEKGKGEGGKKRPLSTVEARLSE